VLKDALTVTSVAELATPASTVAKISKVDKSN
jgi:hypothetical protein